LPVTRDSPLVAYKKIVSAAGPLRLQAGPRPLRDVLDVILVSNLVNQVRHHVSSPAGTGAGNGGFGTLASDPAPADSDRDGMPDFWEHATGSNPAVANHNAAVPGGAYLPAAPAGYTLLEEYLHFRAIPHAIMSRNLADEPSGVDVDLRRYTAGFLKPSAVFVLSRVANGSVSLLADGYTARFIPSTNFIGRARFDFRVQDGDASAWTQTMAVLVTPSAAGGPTAGPTGP
jgi:hypothetical protein